MHESSVRCAHALSACNMCMRYARTKCTTLCACLKRLHYVPFTYIMHARYLHAIMDVRYAHALRACIARVRHANAHAHGCIMYVLWHCLCVVDSIRAHGYTHENTSTHAYTIEMSHARCALYACAMRICYAHALFGRYIRACHCAYVLWQCNICMPCLCALGTWPMRMSHVPRSFN